MNSGGIEHRTTRSTLVTGLSAVLTVAFQLILVSVCLKYWGKVSYGTWLSLYSAFLLLRSLDGGYTTYVGNKLNYLYHHDTNALRVHLSSAVPGLAFIGGFQLMLAAACLASNRMANALGMPADVVAGYDNRLALLVLMASWVLTCSYIGIVHRLLIPAGLIYQAVWWSIPFQISQFGAIMIAATLKLGILHTSLVFALSQVGIYIISAVYIRRKLPSYYPWWKGSRASIGLSDLRQSFMLTISNLINQGTNNGVVVLIAVFGGPAAVPLFTTVRTLSNLWTTATNVFTTPLLADIVRFHAKGELHKLVEMNQAYWVLVGSVVNVGVLLTYPLLAPLYGYWTGHDIALDKILLCVLLSSVVVTNIGGLMALHLNAINRLRFVLGTSLVRCIFALGGGFIFYQQFGLASFGVGILLGELVTLLITTFYFAKYELGLHGVKMRPFDFIPVSLGASSAVIFLLGEAFTLFNAQWSWPLAIAAVNVASWWGWQRLSHDVRTRLKIMIMNKFR